MRTMAAPTPKRVVAVNAGRIDAPTSVAALQATPDWAKAVVARAFVVFDSPMD